MLKRSKILILIMLMLFLSGCSFEVASPDSLIVAPSSSQEKVDLKREISDWLNSDEYLTVPLQMDNKMSYTTADIDNDDADELVAFIKKDSGYELGFAIFKTDEGGQWQLADKVILSGTSMDYFKVVDLKSGDGYKEMLFGINVGGIKYLYVYHYENSELTLVGEEIQYDVMTLGSLNNDSDVQVVTVMRNTTGENYTSEIKLYELNGKQVKCVDSNIFDGYCKELLYTKVTDQSCGLYVTMLHNYQMTTVMVLVCEEDHLLAKAQCLLEDDYASMNNNQIFADINNDGITDVFSLRLPLKNDTGANYEKYLRIWQCWDGKDGFKTIKAEIKSQVDGYTFELPIEWLDSLSYGFEYQGEIEWVVFYYRTAESYVSVFSLASIDRSIWDGFTALQDSAIFLGNNAANNKVYISFIAGDLPEGFNVDAGMLKACLNIDGGK